MNDHFVDRNRLWSRLDAAVGSLPQQPPTPTAVVDLGAGLRLGRQHIGPKRSRRSPSSSSRNGDGSGSVEATAADAAVLPRL